MLGVCVLLVVLNDDRLVLTVYFGGVSFDLIFIGVLSVLF